MRNWFIKILFIPLALGIIGCQIEGLSVASATKPIEKPTTTIQTETKEAVVPTAESSETTSQVTEATTVESQNEPTKEQETVGDGNANVEFVRAVQSADGSWTFHVTVSHPDTGWEDYANGWDVVDPEGNVLKANPDDPFTRLLLHPHENEQPFTRSQGGIVIPEGVSWVTVKAHDLVDGFGGNEVLIDLTTDSGEDYQIER